MPTHTWNVRRTPAVDHGGVLADDRDGAAQVLAALGREPEVDFAEDTGDLGAGDSEDEDEEK